MLSSEVLVCFTSLRGCSHQLYSRCLSLTARCQISQDTVVPRSATKPSKVEKIKHKNFVFDSALRHQLSTRVPRIEKIEVHYHGRGLADNAVMFMNRHLSSPYHCAMHLSSGVAQNAVLALIRPQDFVGERSEGVAVTDGESKNLLTSSEGNSQEVWDLHRPLEYDCDLELLNFSMSRAPEWYHEVVNEAYWRSCAFVLGALMEEAFLDEHETVLHKLPNVPVKSGAFCYDVDLGSSLSDWKPKEEDLIFLTKRVRSIISRAEKFERLDVDVETANEMFSCDPGQLSKVEKLTGNTERSTITVYRLGKHIDITDGPLIPSTSEMFHYVITALHKVRSRPDPDLWRVQGVSLPRDLTVHHSVWAQIEKRARKLVVEDLEHGATTNDEVYEDNLLKYKSIEDESKVYSVATKQWVHNKWKKEEGHIKVNTDQ